METKELPETIAAKVEDWLSPNHSIMHFWRCGDTFLVVALSRGELYFLRVFPIGDSLELSQDNKMDF